MSSEKERLESGCFLGLQCCTRCVNLKNWIKGVFMAFLCPDDNDLTYSANGSDQATSANGAVRDGSAEVLTSSTPGETTESQVMMVKHTLVPCNQDELQVYAGQIVFVLHEENQWVYATTESGEQGFIPSSYVKRVENFTIQSEYEIDKYYRKKKYQRKTKSKPARHQTDNETAVNSNQREPNLDQTNGNRPAFHENKLAKSLSFGEIELGDYDIFGYISDMSLNQIESEQSINGSDYSVIVEPFHKKHSGKYLVLHSFHGEDENDATILKGDCVTVLNKDDHDWYYIQTSDGAEGFAPRSYLWQATCSPVSIRDDDEEEVIL